MYEYRVVFYKIINGDQLDMVLDLGFYVRITQKVKLYGVSILPDKIDDSKDFLTKNSKDFLVKNSMVFLTKNVTKKWSYPGETTLDPLPEFSVTS